MITSDKELEEYIYNIISVDKIGAWEFSVKIKKIKGDLETPKEFDILAKDLSYDSITINSDEKNIGSIQRSSPDSVEKVSLTMTLRDNLEKTNYKFCKKLSYSIINSDGTFNLPGDYLVDLTIYSTTNPKNDPNPDKYRMYISNVSDISPDRSNTEEYREFQVTFIEHKTNVFK